MAQEWEAQAGGWERWARVPGHDRHFHRYNWPAFLELIPDPGRRTVDLGCGESRVGVVLRDLGHRVTGVDVAPSLAWLASRTSAYEHVLVADAAPRSRGWLRGTTARWRAQRSVRRSK